MKNGQCPLCQSNTVFTSSRAILRASGGGFQLTDYGDIHTSLEPYVCGQCGYVAMFMKDQDQVRKLPNAKGWQQVK